MHSKALFIASLQQVTYPRKSQIKNILSLPNFYFPVEAHEAGQIYLGGFENMAPHEHFEIFNAKSCTLSISSERVLFENKLIFFLFIVNLRFESK